MPYWIEDRETTAGKRWYVVKRVNGKKEYNSAGKTYPEAIKLRKELEERELKTHIKPYGIDLTVEALRESYLEHSKTKDPETQKNIKYGTGKFADRYGTWKAKKVGPEDFENFKQALIKDGHEPGGVNIILNDVIAMFGYAVKMEWLEKNPGRGSKIRVVRTVEIITQKEVDVLLKVGCRFNKELRKVIMVALYTGMRVSEIHRAELIGGAIHLKHTKTGRPRVIPEHPKIKGMLPLPLWTRNRIERAFSRAVKRCKFKRRITFHMFRHTFCSNYLASGGTILDLQQISGHRSIQSLQIYAHFQMNYLEERILRYTLN